MSALQEVLLFWERYKKTALRHNLQIGLLIQMPREFGNQIACPQLK